MKVKLVDDSKPKYRKPPRERHIFLSSKLWDVELGHVFSVDKGSFYESHGDVPNFKGYLRNQYRRNFIVIKESKRNWIIKRIKKDEESGDKKEQLRRRRFYFPKRRASNRQVSGEQDNGGGNHRPDVNPAQE
jgi:hypothetical protein